MMQFNQSALKNVLSACISMPKKAPFAARWFLIIWNFPSIFKASTLRGEQAHDGSAD
jgi:hypothetical protein